MKAKLLPRAIVLSATLCLCVVGQGTAAADTARPTLVQQWLRVFLGRSYIPGPNEKSHASVKAAFADVVAAAGRATVQVLSGDEPVALGAIVDRSGYVVTKASQLGDDPVCRLGNGRRLKAEIVGVDRRNDLAVLRIHADDLVPVQWSDGAPPPVGSWLATSRPDGKPLAIGVVSVPPRAVPVPDGVLGIVVEPGSAGPRVRKVVPGSGAEKAGLKEGDVIVQVGHRRTGTQESLCGTIRERKAGDQVKLHVKRGDRQFDVTATLGDHLGAAGLDPRRRMSGPVSRRRDGFPRVLQHDTVLRPWDCGGPVVDLQGKVVGINIARAGRAASYAIPAETVKSVLAELKSGKR